MPNETTVTRGPAPSRPVFSSEDFGLIRKAVAGQLKQAQDSSESAKYANLYHRLGRFAR